MTDSEFADRELTYVKLRTTVVNFLRHAVRRMELSVARDKMLKENNKIIRAERLLPAWFVPRMMTDSWCFGLVLITGQVLIIKNIDNVRGTPGNVWIDVTMNNDSDYIKDITENPPWKSACAPTGRTTASVNAAHVVMALELAGK